MKNTFGNQLTLTLFGESHGPAIGAVLDGLAPGIKVDQDFIAHQLTLRRPAPSRPAAGKQMNSRLSAACSMA